MTMQKISFHWDIKNFYDCDLAVDEFFDSPQFSVTDPKFTSDWKLRMYPAGFKERNNLSLLLLSIDTASIFPTKYSISFLNRIGSRIHTESCSKLCKSSEFTESTTEILEASNIIEIKDNSQGYADGGVLSILCEIELYEKNDEIDAAVPGKHLQMRGTSCVIRNKQGPVDLNIKIKKEIKFCLPYGKISLRFAGLFNDGCLSLKIIDEIHPEIKEVPVTIVCNEAAAPAENTIVEHRTDSWRPQHSGSFSNCIAMNVVQRSRNVEQTSLVVTVKKTIWNIKRTRVNTVITAGNNSSDDLSLQISTRCMVESIPNAFPIDVTPCVRKMQSDYRNMFSNLEAGDISIVVDGKTLRAHKDVLSNRCPVFAAMFNQEWREQATQTVTIKDFDYKTILAMIEFIYFGGGNDDNKEETADQAELLKAAHKYQLDDLKNKCEQRLCQSLEKSNYDSYMALAYAYDLSFLKTETFSFKARK